MSRMLNFLRGTAWFQLPQVDLCQPTINSTNIPAPYHTLVWFKITHACARFLNQNHHVLVVPFAAPHGFGPGPPPLVQHALPAQLIEHLELAREVEMSLPMGSFNG